MEKWVYFRKLMIGGVISILILSGCSGKLAAGEREILGRREAEQEAEGLQTWEAAEEGTGGGEESEQEIGKGEESEQEIDVQGRTEGKTETVEGPLYFCIYLGRTDDKNVTSAAAKEIAIELVSDYG